MLANLRTGDIDGFYVGEPWHGYAAKEGSAFTHFASQDVWRDHPKKCLAANAQFAANRRDELKLVTKAVLEACMVRRTREHSRNGETLRPARPI